MRIENRDCGRVDALDPGRTDKLDAGRGVVFDENLELFLEAGLERLDAGRIPWLFTERLELLEGIMAMMAFCQGDFGTIQCSRDSTVSQRHAGRDLRVQLTPLPTLH